MKMQAAMLYGAMDMRLEEVPVPDISPKEVLVKVEVALTCGTDAKVYLRGGHPRMITPPSTFGHEFSGRIAKVGKEVATLKDGMRVVAANSAPCQSCFYCKIERPSLCEDLLFLNGAYADYIRIPERIIQQNLLSIPEGVSFREAALVEPLACVLHGVEESGIRIGDTVAINGAGPIGILFLQLIKLKGAKAIVTDKNRERLEIAESCGADETIDVSSTDQVEAVRGLTYGGRGVDVAIEAVGDPQVWEKTVAMVRGGGTVLLFGGCPPGTRIEVDTHPIHYLELTIKGIFHHTPYYVTKALDLISSGAIDTKSLITHQLPLGRLSEALEMVIDHRGLKVAIIP